MTEQQLRTAADLPIGSQIAYRGRTIEYRPDQTVGLRWRDDHGNGYTTPDVDQLLADGGHIVFIPSGHGRLGTRR